MDKRHDRVHHRPSVQRHLSSARQAALLFQVEDDPRRAKGALPGRRRRLPLPGPDRRLVIDLAAHPNVAGLKESGGSLAFVAEIVREVPERFHYFVGSGSVFYPGMEMGACGAILAVANAAPEICAELYRLFQAGKKDEARRLQLDLLPLNKALTETYGIAGIKYAQDLRGFAGGPTRLPLLPVDEKGRAEIAALIERMAF